MGNRLYDTDRRRGQCGATGARGAIRLCSNESGLSGQSYEPHGVYSTVTAHAVHAAVAAKSGGRVSGETVGAERAEWAVGAELAECTDAGWRREAVSVSCP